MDQPRSIYKTSATRRAAVAASRAKNKAKYAETKKRKDKEFYQKNKKAIRKKQAVYKDKNREKLNKQSQAINKARLKSDQAYHQACLMRTRIGNFMRGKNLKLGKTFDLIGCTPEELKQHLGERMGAIDHIFPLARYDMKTEQRKMTHYTNLQPLTREENSDKRDQLPTKAMAAKVAEWAWPAGVTMEDLPLKYEGWATALYK
jgi:5-methylcytosine-specific restriction endonuclease McrA